MAGAPARAGALKRYGEMEAPGAYFVLHEEWLPAIACILYPFVERLARAADLPCSRSDRRLAAVRTKLSWPVT